MIFSCFLENYYYLCAESNTESLKNINITPLRLPDYSIGLLIFLAGRGFLLTKK